MNEKIIPPAVLQNTEPGINKHLRPSLSVINNRKASIRKHAFLESPGQFPVADHLLTPL
jgi:hypothetical protein